MDRDKLLIVDDQPDIRKLLRLTLGNHYDLFEAEDAASAWEILRREQPRGVILDVMMPGEMDGYQLCVKIRSDPELGKTYVALVSARGQESDKQRGREVGADDYFVKPYGPLELLQIIKRRLA
ncbi:MAG: response regulator [Sulfuritalea sp.]|nr:response regulator [Sulfuritalea sp.]